MKQNNKKYKLIYLPQLFAIFIASIPVYATSWLNLSNHDGMNWYDADKACKANNCTLPSRYDFTVLRNNYSQNGKYKPPSYLYSYTFWSSEINHIGEPSDIYDTAWTFYGYTGDFFQVRLSGAQYDDEDHPTVRTLCVCALTE